MGRGRRATGRDGSKKSKFIPALSRGAGARILPHPCPTTFARWGKPTWGEAGRDGLSGAGRGKIVIPIWSPIKHLNKTFGLSLKYPKKEKKRKKLNLTLSHSPSHSLTNRPTYCTAVQPAAGLTVLLAVHPATNLTHQPPLPSSSTTTAAILRLLSSLIRLTHP